MWHPLVRPRGDRVGSIPALASIFNQTVGALTSSSVGASGFGAIAWRDVIFRLSGTKGLGIDGLVHLIRGQLPTLAGKLVDPMTSGGLRDESGHGGAVLASDRSYSVSYIWEPPPT